MYARLEQLVKTEQDEFFSLIETQSTRIDYYKTLVTALYTGPIKKKFNPIGTFSDFKVKNNVLRHDIPGVEPLKIQERFDFSGHGGSAPHINYDYPQVKKYEGYMKDLGLPDISKVLKKNAHKFDLNF